MTVVSDTSPITNLIQVGRLELLPDLFGKIVIPTSVFDELNRLPEQHTVLQHVNWLQVTKVKDRTLVDTLLDKLDIGEAESIVLALETKADYLLMDERRGRIKSQELGLAVTGLAGVLLMAKSRKLLSAVKPILDDLLHKGFRINLRLYAELLRLAGEEI